MRNFFNFNWYLTRFRWSHSFEAFLEGRRLTSISDIAEIGNDQYAELMGWNTQSYRNQYSFEKRSS